MDQQNLARKNPYLNQAGDGCAARNEKERAILENSDLVKYIALRLISRLPDHISVDDLMSAGTLGLIDAIEKYDSSQGIPFEYYAKIRI